MSLNKPYRFRVQLIILTLARLVLNTGIRMVYPFAPALSRGLGVEVGAVYRLLTIRSLTGFVSPLFGPTSDRFGRRPVIVISMVLCTLACLLVVIWPAYWPLGATLVLISLAKVIYDPAVGAYLGDAVPFARRGRAIAVIEFAWAGALLVGAPLTGWLIARGSWQSPFLVMAVVAGVTAVILLIVLPPTHSSSIRTTRLRDLPQTVRQHPVIWAAIAYALISAAANEIFFIVYGDWMEAGFNLPLTGLGLAAGVVGGAELLGEGAVGLLVDRFGKRFIVAAGALCILMYGLIPSTSGTLTTALVSLFFLFLGFEMMVVGVLPLLTELVPGARATVMAAVQASSSLGRALGTVIGPFLWERGGLGMNAGVAAVLTVAAVFIIVRWLHVGKGETGD
ncbi:MAG: MFS transporter [Ardenticatenaceae bacterium]|nr:MFS transporter [Ardenticatenaceae bacterium]